MDVKNLENMIAIEDRRIVELLKVLTYSEVTVYQISKATGIPQTTISRIILGKIKVHNLRYKTVLTLYYYLVLQDLPPYK